MWNAERARAMGARARDDDVSDDDDIEGNARHRSKRSRSDASDDEAYVRGAITRVTLMNFMTHAKCEFYPGARLNVIIGPNGTGKSAFVCALCVGLGGATKTLGRAGKVEDFVKRGEENAYVEIALRGARVGEKVVVRREFNIKGNSTWRLNGAVVKQERVMSEMADLNVQLNNLCSFLPQDRVAAFSMLNPQELLSETEKAIGKAELFDQHERLKEMKAAIHDLERGVEQKKSRMEKLQRDNDALQRDVERLRERDELIKEADEMMLKKPWLETEELKEYAMTLKNAYEEQKEIVAAVKAEHGAFLPTYNDVASKSNESVDQIASMQKSQEATKDKIKRCDGKFNKLGGEQDALEQNLVGERQEALHAKEKIQKRLRMIRQHEEELEHIPPVPADLVERMKEVKSRSNAKNDEMRAVEATIHDAKQGLLPHKRALDTFTDQLRKIDSVRDKKIEQLSAHRSFGRLKEADEWVKSKKQVFHGKVFGPLITEIEVTDPMHQKFIEQHLGPHVLATFIVTDPRDERLVSEQMKQFQINVWMPRRIDNFVPGEVSSQLLKAGVSCTMDNLFKADPIVKQSLNDTHRICRVHIGDNTLTSTSVNEIFKAGLSDNVYCPQGVYMHKKSRYDQTASTMSQSEIRPSRFFVSELSNSRQDIVNKHAQAHKKYSECEAEIAQLEQQANTLRHEIVKIQNDLKLLTMQRDAPVAQRKKLELMIAQHKSFLKEEEKLLSVEDVEKKYGQKRKDLMRERTQVAVDLIEQTLLSHKLCREMNVECLRGAERLARTEAIKNQLEEIENRYTELKTKRDELKEKFTKARDNHAAKRNEAMTIAPLTPELEERFVKIRAKTVEELEMMVSNLRERADAILCQNPSALEEFNNRRKEIAQLGKTLEGEIKSLEEKQGEIRAIKDQWLPKLKSVIAKISEKFSDNFAHIACAGQITLSGDGSREHGGFGDDFQNYSLEIRVKFRANEDMHLLDAHRQSGGERSVSTMLYMIALQGFTSAPFRVVDEINQGMDAKNERKVFSRMVEAATVKGTPQCFVVTPKLLTQLRYSKDCTVMCIFNGPNVREMASKWREMQAVFDAESVPTPER